MAFVVACCELASIEAARSSSEKPAHASVVPSIAPIPHAPRSAALVFWEAEAARFQCPTRAAAGAKPQALFSTSPSPPAFGGPLSPVTACQVPSRARSDTRRELVKAPEA